MLDFLVALVLPATVVVGPILFVIISSFRKGNPA